MSADNPVVTTAFGIRVRRRTLNAFSLFTGIAALIGGFVNLTLLPYGTFLPRIVVIFLIIILLGSGAINLAFFWVNHGR